MPSLSRGQANLSQRTIITIKIHSIIIAKFIYFQSSKEEGVDFATELWPHRKVKVRFLGKNEFERVLVRGNRSYISPIFFLAGKTQINFFFLD